MTSDNARAQLEAEHGGKMAVKFSLNPKTVQLTKQNKVEGGRGVITHRFQDTVKASGNIRLSLNGGRIFGAKYVSKAIKQLIEWSTPVEVDRNGKPLKEQPPPEDIFAAEGGDKKKDKNSSGSGPGAPPRMLGLPVLQFSWGKCGPLGGNVPVTLEKVTIHYERWDPTGVPISAKIDLKLVEVIKKFPMTNPTSGGVSGRAMHTVQQGENLVQIANMAYGSPKAWRQVAEANNLDDPLRVRPGRTLTLPTREQR